MLKVDENTFYRAEDLATGLGMLNYQVEREATAGRLRGREVGDETVFLGRDVLAWLSGSDASTPTPAPTTTPNTEGPSMDSDNGPRRTVGPLEREFYARCERKMAATGMNRDRATAAVVHEDPSLHEQMVIEANAGRQRRRIDRPF